MGLPIQIDLNFAFKGEPFLCTQSKLSPLTGMSYAFKAEPFVTNLPFAGWPNKMSGVLGSGIGKINGVLTTAISKVNGV